MALTLSASARADDPWVVYEGKEGPGKGKHIVFVSGDDEYRSEEGLPQLAKILAKHHGFKCTVLFAIDPKDGAIKPDYNKNIPGLEALKTADLMVLMTRYRDLPDDQMKYVLDYVEAGKPVVGLRTATHAFQFSTNKTYLKFSSSSKEKGYEGGFGRLVLGETWVNHLGDNHKQSTLGLIVKGQEENPILRGIKDGDIWAQCGAYAINLPMQKQCQPLVLGQVLDGMKPTDKPNSKKNDPLMPVAWTTTYQIPDGKMGKSFTTTMGASQDFESEGMRRLVVNACYWALGMADKIPEKTKVDIVGEYKPTAFGFGAYTKGVKPSDLADK